MLTNNADLVDVQGTSTRTPKSFVQLPQQSAIVDHTDDDYITSDVQPSGVEDFTENEGWNDSEEEAVLERNDALLEKMAKQTEQLNLHHGSMITSSDAENISKREESNRYA